MEAHFRSFNYNKIITWLFFFNASCFNVNFRNFPEKFRRRLWFLKKCFNAFNLMILTITRIVFLLNIVQYFLWSVLLALVILTRNLNSLKIFHGLIIYECRKLNLEKNHLNLWEVNSNLPTSHKNYSNRFREHVDFRSA